MTYSITTTPEEDAVIAQAAAVKGLSVDGFVAAVGSRVLVDVAERVVADQAALDRAAYLAAYDVAPNKAALRSAVDAVAVIAVAKG